MSERTGLRPLPLTAPLPSFQAAYSYDRPELLISQGLVRFINGHLARHCLRPLRRLRPARFAVVAGKPGDGKSEGIKVVCSRAGIDLVTVAAAAFAGSTEDGAALLFDKALADVERIRAARGLAVALALDDADLSVFADRAHTEYAVSRDVLLGRLQKFGDEVAIGAPLPTFLTVNETNVFRASLLRHGRAVFYTHAPTQAEKIRQVAALLGATTAADLALVADLVARHAQEPIAFFVALKEAALDDVIAAAVDEVGVTSKLAEEEVALRLAALTTADFVSAAARRSQRPAATYL